MKRFQPVRVFTKLLLVLSVLIFSYFIFKDIHLPYVGPNAGNFNVYSLISHNFNRFGYLQTRFAPLISVTKDFPKEPEYFFHHPTLLSFVESLLFKLFGEQFWVGRLTVIIFAFGSFILTYFIAKQLLSSVYAVLTTAVMTLIPATSVFGKYIGQEPLVLFFILLLTHTTIRYVKTSKKPYMLIGFISVFFGILSDWPMLYFPIFLLPFLVKNKQTKLVLWHLAFAGGVVAILLFWISSLMGGFWDLQNAVGNRSFQNLMHIPYWPIRWLAATALRMALYLNPIIVLLTAVFFYKTWRLSKKLTDANLIILGLVGFGLFHILLYTEASFTHPYLIYYILPGVALSAALVLQTVIKRKRYALLAGIFIFSLLWLVAIDRWKTEQVTSNLWRYEFAKSIVVELQPYEKVLINHNYAVDTDLLWYPFLIDWEAISSTDAALMRQYDHFVYSCSERCTLQHNNFAYLSSSYKSKEISFPLAQAVVFDLKQKTENTKKVVRTAEDKVISEKQPPSQDIRTWYRKIKDLLYLPQI